MRVHQLALALIALVVLREVAGEILIRLTGLGALANLGGLAIASFAAGWLAGKISKLGPSHGQLAGLAALGVVASLAISFMQGVSFLPPAVVMMLILYTPLSYVCLLLGARVAEAGMEVPPRQEADSLGSARGASDTSAQDPSRKQP